MDQILHADDAVLAKVLFDQFVVGKRDTLLVDLAVSALVDELTDRLEVGVAVCDKWLDNPQHLGGSLSETHEDTVVDLEKTKKLQGLALLRVDLVDTLDADDKDKLGFGRDVE